MATVVATAWVPIRKLLRFDSSMPDDFYKCLEDLVPSLPMVLKQLSASVIDANTQLLRPTEEVARDLFLLSQSAPSRVDFYEFLRIDSTFSYDKEALEAANRRTFSDEDMGSFAACDLSSIVEDALVLAQLAYPVRVKTETGRTWFDQHPLNPISRITGFPYDFLSAQEPLWLSLETMPLTQILEWELKLGLCDQGVARTPVQKALAAFTHAATLSVDRSGELLFWAMQGLEAFYCRGTGDLRRQLSEKSQIFLGSWEDKKNIVGHLYDFRSKFVHGGFDLTRWNNSREVENRDDSDAFYIALLLSVKMLVATLQRCAKERIVGVDFDYAVRIHTG